MLRDKKAVLGAERTLMALQKWCKFEDYLYFTFDMARKPIKTSIQKRLYAASGNQCSFPDCANPVYDIKEKALLGEMCHINAVSPDGLRFDPDLTEEQINSYENLIILCPTHHSLIDQNEEKYDAETLRRMKFDHEMEKEGVSVGFDINEIENSGKVHAKSIEELEAVEELLKDEDINIELPVKKDYEAPQDYIVRQVVSVNDDEGLFGIGTNTLSDIIKKKDRLTILGVAGSGKSVELEYIAHIHSQVESPFYPVKIRLNTLTNQSIETLLELEYPNYKSIPHQRLLLLLDALDEVHSDFLDIAVSNIELLSKKYSQAKIVVSCRNNFYTTETDNRKARITGFETYLIRPLGYHSIHDYISRKLNVDPDKLIHEFRKKKFYDLLYSPFYLVHLVQYYDEKGEVPESKKTVFDYLVNQRIESDFEKYENVGLDLRDHTLRIEEKIEKLAVIGEGLGRNYLDEKEEVLPLFSDSHLLKVIKRTFLFNKSAKTSRWEFEHNNFQEFLAARFLCKLEVERIKKFVSFHPDYRKIKPSWLNTLSFVISILDKGEKLDALLHWLMEIEPDVLVRFEKDKIKLHVREHLFKKLYELYEDKGIVIRSEKFEAEDLALFVSDSNTTIEYLISKVKKSDDRLVLMEALRLFPVFTNIPKYKSQIESILISKISKPELSNEVKFYCLTAMASLGIYSNELSQRILDKIDLGSDQNIRAGFYKYLSTAENVDQYLSIMLGGIKGITPVGVSFNRNRQPEEAKLMDEEIHLEALFRKVSSESGFKEIFDWAAQIENYSGIDDLFYKVLQSTLEKAGEICEGEDSPVYESVLNLLIELSKRYGKELADDFQKFFKNSSTELSTFKRLYDFSQGAEDNQKTDFYIAMGCACNADGIAFLVKEIEEGRLVDPATWRIRNFLSFNRPSECSELYQKELVKIDKVKYHQESIDFDALKKARLEKDVQMLLDKGSFLTEVIRLFKEEQVDGEITLEQLWDWKKKNFRAESMTNNIVVDTLRRRASDKKFVTLQEIESLVTDDFQWKWFVLHNLVSIDKNTPDFKFSFGAKEFLVEWVKKEIENCDFSTAIELNSNGNYTYRYTELFVSYFTQRLDITLPSSNYLDFLKVDCHLLPRKEKQGSPIQRDGSSKTVDFLEGKLGLKAVTKQIIQNLKEGLLVPMVKESHYRFCREHALKEVAPIIFEELKENTEKEDGIRRQEELISLYVDLDGNFELLIQILDSFDASIRLHACEEIAKKGWDSIIPYIKICLQDGDIEEENKLRYTVALARVNPNEAFPFMKEWIIGHQQFPDRSSKILEIDRSQLDNLMEVFEDSLIHNYGTDFWTSRNDYLAKIIELGSLTDPDYLLVRDKLNYWIGKFEGAKFLHYQIQYLEQQYYSKKSESMTFEKVMQLINSEYEPQTQTKIPSKVNQFWEHYKVVIEIFLAIVAIASLVLALV